MRILVIFGNIPLLGKERANLQVLKVLKDRGAEILVATNKEWGHESIQPMLDQMQIAWAPVTVAPPLRKTMGVADLLKVARAVVAGWWELLHLARRFEPTHIHTMNEYQTLYNVPVLKLLRVPVIYRLGDAPAQGPTFLKVLWSKLVAPVASQWVCISEFIKREAIKSGVPDEKIRVIYNYPPERLASLPQRNADGDTAGRTVVYVGQLSEEKGVGLLIDAAIDLCAARDDVHFLLAGDYTWRNPFAEGLIDRVGRLGLTERIQFLGYVDDIPALFARADLHVCPSVWEEPLSNVVPEAKLAAVPSVVFASGGLPELIEHDVDGWICAQRTAAGLKEGILHFLEMNEDQLQQAAEAARASMEALGITRQAFADAWVQVYA